MVGGDSASDGVPLLTRVLLVRASVRFDPSFPLDGVSCSPSSCRSPTTATSSSSARDGGVRPTLRVVAHYARGTTAGNAGPLRSATSTPRDDAAFFDSHVALHQALTSMAADRLGEKVRLRQLQTHVAKTTVKLARVLTSTTAVATTAAAGGRGKEAAASPDPASLFADSLSQVSSPSTKASLYVTKQEDDNKGGGSSHHGANRSDGHGDRGGVSGAAAHNAQVQGMLAAATATFAEDAAWRSLTTPHRPQLNPWCLTPIADEGCFLSVPTPAYVHWCELHCAQCCSKNNNTSSGGGNSRAVGTAAPLSDTEPDAQGGGTMRYLDTLHYTSASAAGEAALHHGYAFLLDGAVFSGWDDNPGEDGPPSASTAAAGEKTPFRGDSGEMSVLLWCVLSDAPVFNFMRSVTMEAVAAMSYVAQRTYHETTSATASTRAASASATTRMGTGVPVDVYTGLLESALRDEVVLPIARELLQPGTAASRAVPGESFTVSLPLARGRQSGVAARPQTSSMSGTLPFRRPLDLLFPCADVPLSTLLLSFGEDALRVLQSLMLQEERIVVIGATPQHASACVVSLPALIAPLLWVSPLVPYLPPHTAAQTGFLYTLLSTPYEMQQQQQQSSSPVVSRPATTASGSATQSSQHMESAGFLLGSTAAIRPYLMFLSSFGIAEAGVGGGGHRPRSGRAPRVWIADARSGAVGPCPTEPITPYFRVDRPLSTAEGSGGGGGGAAATTAAHNGKDAKDESCSGRSRSVQGGASAWTLAAHLDLRLAAPHVFASSGGGGGGGGTAQNPYVLYNAVRNTLRTAAEQNVMDAAPLDVLPPFQDDLCDALRRVASAEKRRQFRAALEDVAQHRRARVDGLESLAARLRRGLRHALAASAAAAAATAGNARGASGGIRASCVADTTDTDSDNNDGSDSDSGSDESSSSGSSSDVSDGEAMRRWDENASFHAVTQAVRPSSALGCADASATAASSSSSSPSVFAVAQFPSLPVSEVLQVQAGLLAYVVGRIVGAYRRGLSASSSSAATHRGSRRRYIQAPVFLVPGLDQHYTLAETVARTHLFRQFECTVLAAEAAGLRRTLCGEQLVASRVDSEHSSGGGSDGRGVLRHINTLSMFALLLDRARLQFPDLYADHPSLDALGTVYASLVKHCFQHRPGTPAPPSVPPTIRVIAGGGPSTVSNSSGGGNGGGGGVSGSNSGGGGGGGGFKNFLNKAAKAMKLHSSSGSGGGLGGGGGGGWGGGGGGRRLPVVYVPASVACMTSFIVPPFSAQNVAPPSFPMLAPAPAGTTGYTTIHDVRAQERRHHHQRGLRRHHHDENDNTGKKEKKKKKKKQSKRRGKHHGSELYAVIPSAPRRQQWARQQQHQQRSALDMDFTLDDCTTVVRNHHVPGGVSGSLSSSFSASTGAAVAAAAAARAAAGAGGFPTNATNSTVNSSGSGAYSGGAAGIDAEVLTALAQAGGARGGGGSEATRRVMAEASLSICHALPLDLVHQFDAYEHLLAPLCAPSTTASVSAEAKAEADELSGPLAFMRVGLCCPTCVNVWREGEARAIHTLQQQQEEERQQYRHPQQQPQQQAQRHSVPSPFPPLYGNTSSSPLPPMPAKTGSLSTPQEVQLWSTPPPTTPHPSRVVPDAFAVTPAVMEDTASSWGAFTSGAPQGYPVDAMMSLDYPTQSLPRPDRTVGGAATSTPFAASPVVSSTRMTGTPASAFAPSPPMPQMNAHQDVWDSWGVQAPIVENTPTTAAPPAVMVGNYPNAATPTAPAASSLSVNGSSVNWTTTATSTPPMMVTTRMAEGGRGEGVFPPRLPPPLPLPQATSSSSSVSMARPLAAPAPGDVMDELFAGLSSYNNGASGSGSATMQQQQQQQQPRRQTLDDFF